MNIREFNISDLENVKKLIGKLHPKWFTSEALMNIPIDLGFQKCFVAEEENTLVGFISVRSQDGKPFIGWMGVDPNLHGRGIGKTLLHHTEAELKKSGVTALRVKTVVEQNPKDGSYDHTVEFYKACGFTIERKSQRRKKEKYVYWMGILKKNLE